MSDKELLLAIKEAESLINDPNTKKYNSFQEIIDEIKSEIKIEKKQDKLYEFLYSWLWSHFTAKINNHN